MSTSNTQKLLHKLKHHCINNVSKNLTTNLFKNISPKIEAIIIWILSENINPPNIKENNNVKIHKMYGSVLFFKRLTHYFYQISLLNFVIFYNDFKKYIMIFFFTILIFYIYILTHNANYFLDSFFL